MSKISNSSETSYFLSTGNDFKNQHVKVHYNSPCNYSGISGQYFSLKLKAIEHGVFSYNHYVMFTKFINKFKGLKKITYLRVRPYLNTTKKPAEVRMGKGKGKFDKKIFFLSPGTFILEVRFKIAAEVSVGDWLKQKKVFLKDCLPMMLKFSSKLPIKTVVVFGDL